MKESPKREERSAISILDREAVLQEVDRILTSSHFCNSKRYPALLRYIVESTLEGRSDSLKERTLGVEIFGRTPDYDTNSDTIVRYTAGEVRKRLLLYYSDEGRDSDLRISLAPGSYVPEFHPAIQQGPVVESHLQPAISHPAESLSEPEFTERPGQPSETPSILPAPHPLISKTWKSQRRSIVGAVLLGLFALSGFALWRWTHRISAGQSAITEFWAPMSAGQQPVFICTGSVVFAQGNYSGTTTANRDVDYPFVSMQSASAIARVSGLLERSGATIQLLPSSTTPLTQLQQHPVVLLGGYNNPWTIRLLQPLRYHFAPDPAHTIVDSTRPQFLLARDHSLPYSSADDYALVVRFRDPVTDSWSVVFAGLGRNGTEAAADFATDPHYMQMLRDRISGGFGNRNIEAVLEVPVIDGKTGAPSILDVFAW